jgi:hypothetical protein
VQQLSGLIEHHVPRLHDQVDLVVRMVQDEQGPVLVHVLVHVDDGRHHVRVHCVHVHAQHRAVGVLAVRVQCVCAVCVYIYVCK